MYLKHILPSNEYVIPIDASAALAGGAFATVHDEDGKTNEITHRFLGWTLVSTMKNTTPPEEGKKARKAKYEGHEFLLCIPPEHIDKAIDALMVAKTRFTTQQLPVEVIGLPAPDEDDDESEE